MEKGGTKKRNTGKNREGHAMKPKKKRRKEETRGRPGRPMAEKIPDTPENIMRAILGTPPKKRDEWDFMREVPESERKEITE